MSMSMEREWELEDGVVGALTLFARSSLSNARSSVRAASRFCVLTSPFTKKNPYHTLKCFMG